MAKEKWLSLKYPCFFETARCNCPWNDERTCIHDEYLITLVVEWLVKHGYLNGEPTNACDSKNKQSKNRTKYGNLAVMKRFLNTEKKIG